MAALLFRVAKSWKPSAQKKEAALSATDASQPFKVATLGHCHLDKNICTNIFRSRKKPYLKLKANNIFIVLLHQNHGHRHNANTGHFLVRFPNLLLWSKSENLTRYSYRSKKRDDQLAIIAIARKHFPGKREKRERRSFLSFCSPPWTSCASASSSNSSWWELMLPLLLSYFVSRMKVKVTLRKYF